VTERWRVRRAKAGDEADWRRLWRAYCDFYAIVIAPDVTDVLWRRIAGEREPIFALVAEIEGGAGHSPFLIGMANCVLHPYTWGTEQICYLEDLFVAKEARGLGVGSALIRALIQLSRENGWPRLYWNTHQDNRTARSLYNKFTPADPFVRYTVKLTPV
jgi:GNAT superfamily N-acetyltransferase